MAHRNLRDDESDGGERSDVPIIFDSPLNPGVRMTRAGVGYKPDTTTLTLQRTTPLQRGKLFPERHGRKRPYVSAFGISDQFTRDRYIEDMHRQELGKAALLAKASMGTLEPPKDKSIKTLLVRGLNPSILEQDIRVQFGAYGEIESIRFLAEEGRAFVTYTTREAAEKATQELSKWLVINGQRLTLSWGGPQVPQSDQDSSKQAVARSLFLSNQAVGCRRFLSQHDNDLQLMGPLELIGSMESTVSSTGENNKGASSSTFRIICNSSSNPGVGMTRAGVGYKPDTTTLTLQRTTPLQRGKLFPERHGGNRPYLSASRISDQCARDRYIEDMHRQELCMAALLAKASMGTLEPPKDKSIKTLLVRGLNPSILEQDIRVQFGAYGEIESIRFLAEEGRAFVTYTTREAAEKATQELSKWLVINGQRLTLSWGGPQVPQSDQDSSKQAVARSLFLSNQAVGCRRFLSQHDNDLQLMGPLELIGSMESTVSSTGENNKGASSSTFRIICNSSSNPGVGMTRAGVGYKPDTTTLTLQRTTPLQRGKLFPERHGGNRPYLSASRISDQCARDRYIEDMHRQELCMAALLAKASMGTLEPPKDKSIKTLLVRGLNPSILEQDIRVQFGAYGEIESIRFLAEEGRAFVTYTTREAAEKATQELSKWLVINGQRLTLSWGGPQVPQSDQDSSKQAVARSLFLSNQAVGCRRFLSQHDNDLQLMGPLELIGSMESTVSSTGENNRGASSSSFRYEQ